MRSLYSEHPTWLHRVPAGAKLLVLALLGTGLFLVQHLGVLAVVASVCVLGFASLGRATAGVRKLVLSIVLGSALVALFHAALGQALWGLTSALRLSSVALLGTALTLTTTPSDLLTVLERLLSPLARLGVRVDLLALQLALMLRFTEHFFVLWKRLDEAHRLRTGRAGGLRLLAPLIIQTLMAARRVADTLQVRLGR
ncbi:CbiQ family ECF transporter T component [Macromonas nakdongensis]|uniref:CbiQ family ECF transporter T component n=1 Tax=Macromonas nakdongensis TaxID=1843082 RepID=UPI000C325ADF|nr:CbiQ family ECF transporter T component [Macromonas nakdongensis]